jgi:hypothetical protein
MQQPSMRHRSFNTAWTGLNYTGNGKSAVQLSFALLFSSIRAFFCKKNYLKFSLQFPAAHMELFLNGYSINSAPIITKIDTVGKFGHHL